MLFIVLLSVLLVSFCVPAGAAVEPVVGTMELSPAYLTGPGKVNVSITISNATDEDFKEPVTLYDPAAQIVSDFGTKGSAMLKAGESLTWTGSYDVNQRTLDNGSVVYFVKYTSHLESGEAIEQSLPIRAKISQQSEEAIMDVKRTISPSVAQDGQKVTVDYHITNAGTVSLTNIVIQENADVHKQAQKIPELKAGQTADISYPVTMGKKNLTSGATITYKADGSKEEKTYVVEDQTIAYGNSNLTAKLTSSSKGVVVNNVFTLTLQLKNSGSVDFSDIRVNDPTLGEVFSNQKLEAGKTLNLEKELTLTGTQNYQFTVTAIDSTGTESVTGTETVTVTAVNPEDALSLKLIAAPDKTEAFGNPAKVRFSITITNDSNVEATDVTVSHGNVDLYTFASIPAGQSRTLTRDTALSTSGKFQFTAAAQDPLENDMTFKSNEMQIAVYAPTPEPATPTPPPNPTPEPTFNPTTVIPIRDASIGAIPKGIQSVLLPVLIIAGILLIASCVLLLLATKRRHDQKRASEAAYDHLERAKRRDYISPAEDAEPEIEQTVSENEPDKKKKLSKEEQDKQMKNRRIVGDDDEDLPEWELPHLKFAREAEQTTVDKDDDSYAVMGHGLYDEEMTSDLTGYSMGDELAEGDASDGLYEDVMYEQPYEDEAFNSQSPETQAYTGVYSGEGEAQQPYQSEYSGLAEDQQYYDDALETADTYAYTDDFQTEVDGYTQQLADDYSVASDDESQVYDDYQADYDQPLDNGSVGDSPIYGNDAYDDLGFGDALDNDYRGDAFSSHYSDSAYIPSEDAQSDGGRRRSRQSRADRND